MSVFLILLALTVPLALAATGILWLIFIAIGIFEPGGQRWRLWKTRPKTSFAITLSPSGKTLYGGSALAGATVSRIATLEGTGQAMAQLSVRVFLKNGGWEEGLTRFETAADGRSKFLLAVR